MTTFDLKDHFDCCVYTLDELKEAHGNVYIAPDLELSASDLLMYADNCTSITTKYGEKMICFVVGEIDGK